MSNTAEFEALSPEAKVVVGAFWGLMMSDKVQFDRPWVIHPRTRKGLDDLVAAGYLTSEPLNRYPNAPMLWKPTEKMRTERPKVSRSFIENNSFPITDESQPEPALPKRRRA